MIRCGRIAALGEVFRPETRSLLPEWNQQADKLRLHYQADSGENVPAGFAAYLNERLPMSSCSNDTGRAFPPRLLRPDERELLAEWLAAAGDIASAYVSSRKNDDPEIRRRIVISTAKGGGPTHFIDTPTGTDLWIVVQLHPDMEAYEFRSLREALNFVRAVLPD